MAPLTLALWAGGVLAAIGFVPLLAHLHRLLRVRLQPIRWARRESRELPESLQALFRRAIRELAALGFEAVSMTMKSPEIVDAPSAPSLWLVHRDRVTWALVGFSSAPTTGAPLRLALITSFKNESTLTTMSGEAWTLWSNDAQQRVLDTHRAHWDEQLRDHWEAVAATRAEPVARELSALLANEERGFSLRIATFPAVDASAESAHYLPVRALLKLAWRARFPSKALRHLRRAQRRLPAWEPEHVSALPLVQAHQCDALRAIVKSPPRHCPAWVLLVVGSVFIPLVFVPWRPLSKVSQLMVVLLIHELGRWLVLRFAGDCAPGLFPIPFFDVVTAGPMRDGSFWRRFLIHAAGPVPGVVAGALALSIVSNEHETIRALATTAVAINAAHLLPAMPLDGGRLVQHVAASVHPRLELALGFLGVAALTGLTLVAQHPVLVLLLIATVLSANIPYYSARAALQLKRAATDTDEQLSIAINTLVQSYEIDASTKPAVALRAFERLRSASATRTERTLGLLCYLTLLGIAVASVGYAYVNKAHDGELPVDAVSTAPLK